MNADSRGFVAVERRKIIAHGATVGSIIIKIPQALERGDRKTNHACRAVI